MIFIKKKKNNLMLKYILVKFIKNCMRNQMKLIIEVIILIIIKVLTSNTRRNLKKKNIENMMTKRKMIMRNMEQANTNLKNKLKWMMDSLS